MEQNLTLSDLVRNNTAKFVRYRQGNLIYSVNNWEFPVPLDDTDDATFQAEDKAIFFMRWIRRHFESIRPPSGA